MSVAMSVAMSNDAVPNARTPWWVTAIVILGALLMATGAVIALLQPARLVPPHDEINGAVHVYAGYFAARALALAIMLMAALTLRARAMLQSLMLLTVVIQALDLVMDCLEARWAVIPGVLVLGLLFLAAWARLARRPAHAKADA